MTSWTEHRQKVKFEAKLSLSGNLLKGIWMTMIYLTISALAVGFIPINVPTMSTDISKMSALELLRMFAPEKITIDYIALILLSLALFLLVASPLKIGMHRFFLQSTRGEKPKFRVAFLYYTSLKQVFGSVLLTLSIAILTLLWGVLLFGVPLLLLWFSPTLGPLATIIGMPLYVLAIPTILIMIAPYALAPFLFAEDTRRGAFGSIQMAIRRVRGVRFELALFQFTFLPWRIMVLLTYPFGSFFFTPYELSAYARFLDTIETRKADAV